MKLRGQRAGIAAETFDRKLFALEHGFHAYENQRNGKNEKNQHENSEGRQHDNVPCYSLFKISRFFISSGLQNINALKDAVGPTIKVATRNSRYQRHACRIHAKQHNHYLCTIPLRSVFR